MSSYFDHLLNLSYMCIHLAASTRETTLLNLDRVWERERHKNLLQFYLFIYYCNIHQ